jgi:putative hemin transport protein
MAAASHLSLNEIWQRFQVEHPKVRIRDAAVQLSVSEAQLVATGCGENVTRLSVAGREHGWGAVLQRLPALGYVMALTRNEHCVHERKGRYREVGIYGTMGSVVGPDIDLRFFLNRWHVGFAVREESAHGPRESLQFFDRDGTAIHKVYLQPDSDRAAFEVLMSDFQSADQGPEQSVEPWPPRAADKPDSEVDVAAFAAGWRAMEDTHEFFSLLKTHALGRAQALRLIGPEFASPIAPTAAGAILRGAAAEALPIMVFVANPGMIQIHTGPVSKIAPHGEWINVLDDEFNLHLRQPALTQAWTVRKPTKNGFVTSAEFFDATGDLIVQFFGKRKPGESELPEWRALAANLPAL